MLPLAVGNMYSDEPVKIYDAWNLFQAHFLVQSLAEAGISARVASDSIEGLSGRVPFSRATCPVWVANSDIARARPIVEQYDRRIGQRSTAPDDAAVPFCYHCGAPLDDAQVSPCPQCGCQLDWSE